MTWLLGMLINASTALGVPQIAEDPTIREWAGVEAGARTRIGTKTEAKPEVAGPRTSETPDAGSAPSQGPKAAPRPVPKADPRPLPDAGPRPVPKADPRPVPQADPRSTEADDEEGCDCDQEGERGEHGKGHANGHGKHAHKHVKHGKGHGYGHRNHGDCGWEVSE